MSDPSDSAEVPDPNGVPGPNEAPEVPEAVHPTAGLDTPTAARLAEARRALEAVLMVVDTPAEATLLAQLIELPTDTVEQVLVALAESYESEDRGFQLVRVAGGWRFQSHPDCAPWVERFVLSGQSHRLSAAALETLAIVAYKQPISRGQIAAIRGVNVDGVVRTLEHRGYIAEIGRDDGPGLAIMYGTTRLFLERLGIDDLSELPSLGDFIPDAGVVEALEHGLRPVDEADPLNEPDGGDPTPPGPVEDVEASPG